MKGERLNPGLIEGWTGED